MTNLILSFTFAYPFFMSIFWMIGAVHFYFSRERKQSIVIDKHPFVSIVIPCFNEERTIKETIQYLIRELNYPNYEILIIDDGSTDETWNILQKIYWENKYPQLRIIRIMDNLGKAHALTQGAIASKGEFLLGLDADSLLEPDAIAHMISHFIEQGNEHVGAVTGNPVVRNRSTLLSRIQLAEYASIIGMIKRTQSLFGKINTVSGVCTMFRKRALLQVGFWDQDMVTEDISITWKLQNNNWLVKYEPNALCWMLVPETLKGLWRQRIRWAQGGIEVLLHNRFVLLRPRQWKQLLLWLDNFASLLWSFLWYIAIALFFYEWWITGVPNFIAVLFGAILVFICMLQFFVSLLMMKKYDKASMRYLFWAGWYPFVYWLVNPLTIMASFPRAIRRVMKGGQATWTSPDRGIE